VKYDTIYPENKTHEAVPKALWPLDFAADWMHGWVKVERMKIEDKNC